MCIRDRTSADDFETGTIAAAHGGTTSIVDFAIQYRGQTLHHAWDTWMKKAEGKAAIDYGFHMIMTELNDQVELCLLYTSDAADERSSGDLGGRRIIKQKKI